MPRPFGISLCIVSRALALGVLVLLLDGVANAQASSNQNSGLGGRSGVSHSIRGKIFMPNGSPAELRIRVVLEVNTGGVAGEAFSDSAGNFEFRALSNGTYKITIPTDNHTYETSQEMIEISSSFSRTFTTQIYLREKGADQMRPKGHVLTAADLQEVPKEAKKAYEKGLKRASEKKPDEAVAQFELATRIFPEYLYALNKLGEQRAILGNAEQAQAAYEKAIAVNAKYALSYINLGILFVNQKRYEDAIPALESGNRLEDTFPMGHMHLGLAYMLQATPNTDGAEKEFLRAVDLGKSDFAQAHLYLFNLYKRRNAWPKAVAQLEAYLKAAPLAANAEEVRMTLDKIKKMLAEQAGAPAGKGH